MAHPQLAGLFFLLIALGGGAHLLHALGIFRIGQKDAVALLGGSLQRREIEVNDRPGAA
jgi:hypothetical protein